MYIFLFLGALDLSDLSPWLLIKIVATKLATASERIELILSREASKTNVYNQLDYESHFVATYITNSLKLYHIMLLFDSFNL